MPVPVPMLVLVLVLVLVPMPMLVLVPVPEKNVFLWIFRFLSLWAGLVPKSTICKGKVQGNGASPKSIFSTSLTWWVF